MARANSRGKVWRKPLAKLRADEQEHHMRRRLKVRWHKTSKPRDLTTTVNDDVCLEKIAGHMMRAVANQDGDYIDMVHDTGNVNLDLLWDTYTDVERG